MSLLSLPPSGAGIIHKNQSASSVGSASSSGCSASGTCHKQFSCLCKKNATTQSSIPNPLVFHPECKQRLVETCQNQPGIKTCQAHDSGCGWWSCSRCWSSCLAETWTKDDMAMHPECKQKMDESCQDEPGKQTCQAHNGPRGWWSCPRGWSCCWSCLAQTWTKGDMAMHLECKKKLGWINLAYKLARLTGATSTGSAAAPTGNADPAWALTCMNSGWVTSTEWFSPLWLILALRQAR